MKRIPSMECPGDWEGGLRIYSLAGSMIPLVSTRDTRKVRKPGKHHACKGNGNKL